MALISRRRSAAKKEENAAQENPQPELDLQAGEQAPSAESVEAAPTEEKPVKVLRRRRVAVVKSESAAPAEPTVAAEENESTEKQPESFASAGPDFSEEAANTVSNQNNSEENFSNPEPAAQEGSQAQGEQTETSDQSQPGEQGFQRPYRNYRNYNNQRENNYNNQNNPRGRFDRRMSYRERIAARNAAR